MTPNPGAIDFQNPPADHKYKFSFEPNEAMADRNVRLFKDVVVFLLAVGFVLLIVWLCVSTVWSVIEGAWKLVYRQSSRSSSHFFALDAPIQLGTSA